MKVLVSAYACSPYRGSEPGVGWGFVYALAKKHDLHVIVEEEKFRDDIESWLLENPEFRDRVRFHYIRKRRNRPLRKIWPPSYYWYYRRWHEDAYRLAKRLHELENFDVVHQLTMVGFREPGYLWRLRAPFVWGPIGGLGVFPWQFLPHVGIRGAVHYLGYNCYNVLQAHLLRRPRRAAAVAGPGLIAATRENAARAAKLWGVKPLVLCEVGVPDTPPDKPKVRQESEPLRLVWSGNHTPGKALNLGLHALATLPSRLEWRLDVLGSGPLTAQWRALARRLGITKNVNFLGRVPRHEALEAMSQSHALIITSLRDLTSTVTAEGLRLGLPIVCPNHCGFGDLVDASCGVLLPLSSKRAFTRALCDAIVTLHDDEQYRRRLARGSLSRSSVLEWPTKADALSDLYRTVLNRKAKGQ